MKKQETISFRVSSEEKQKIKVLADNQNVSTANLCENYFRNFLEEQMKNKLLYGEENELSALLIKPELNRIDVSLLSNKKI